MPRPDMSIQSIRPHDGSLLWEGPAASARDVACALEKARDLPADDAGFRVTAGGCAGQMPERRPR